MEFAEPLSNSDGKAQKIGGGDTLQVLAVLLHGRLEYQSISPCAIRVLGPAS
jgi:hypothetical protein